MNAKRCSRDKFSGHWWIRMDGGWSIEAYRAGRYMWYLNGLYKNGESLFKYIRLDKSNTVYSIYNGHVAPDFHSLKALVGWVQYIHNPTEWKTL